MELHEYLNVLRRRVWIPLVLVAVTVLSAGALAILAKPEYTATATVIARSTGTLSFPEVATSNTVALRVMQQVPTGESVDRLLAKITVSPGRSNLYRVSVTDPSPSRAVAIANAVGTEAAALYQKLAGTAQSPAAADLEKERTNFRNQYVAAATAVLDAPRTKDLSLAAQAAFLQLDQQAASDAYLRFQQQITQARVNDLTNARNYSSSVVDEAAAKPDTGARLLRVLYAAALALALGIGLIFVLEYLDHSVRDPDTVEELVGVPLIGIIPRATTRSLRPAKGAVG
jgi:capsular polysaccharide biosynthesis protein